MTAAPTYQTVAAYLTQAIEESGKLQREIAQELGYDNQNVITMFKLGLTKLPLNKVGPMAKALGVDPGYLLQVVMQEYMPETWFSVREIMENVALSCDELQVLTAYRQHLIDAHDDPMFSDPGQPHGMVIFCKGVIQATLLPAANLLTKTASRPVTIS